MSAKTVPPSISSLSFSCPHCGALADQTWYDLFASPLKNPDTPLKATWADIENARANVASAQNEESKGRAIAALAWWEKFYQGSVLLTPEVGGMSRKAIVGLHLSECFSCKRLAVWVHDKIASPPQMLGIEPNEDLPDDIRHDFQEARSILSLSTRGAAALLRLCIQKLCVYLGQPGKRIDDDIANLVARGLDVRVQRALDIVRVVGNESVHPGSIDISDDQDTALKLFGLVNLIAEKMLSEPKHVNDLYEALPATKREAIERRDKK